MMSEADQRMFDRLYVRLSFAAVLVVAALWLRLAMEHYLGVKAPFITFYPAVMTVAVLAGFWPGVLATALASVLAEYWIFQPRGHFAVASTADIIALCFFAGMGVFMSTVAERYRHGRRHIEEYERKQVLRKSEEQFETLANAIPQLCWMANPDGWIFWYNQRWYGYTGTTPAQMEGWGWQSVQDPEVLPKVVEQWNGSIASGEPFDMVLPLRGADGVFRPFLTRVMPVKDAEGKVIRWFGTNTDIGAQKQAEAELRKSEERLALAVEVAKLGEWELDLSDHSAFRSLRHDQIFGYNKLLPEWTYEMFLGHVLPEHRAAVDETFKASAISGKWDFETQIKRVDGEVRWIWARGRVQPAAKGQASRMVGTVMDITERKQAEWRIARLASFPELSPYPIFEADLGGTITYVNPAARRRFPTLQEAGIAHPLLKDWSRVAESLKSEPEHLLVREIESDGQDYFQTLYYSPEFGVARSYFADITERKRAERALRASEKRWATTLQSIGDAVISTDASGRIEFMNEVAQRLTGWPWTEARGRELDEVFDIVHETTRIKPESPVAKVIRLGKVVGLANHTVLIGRDGRETPIDDSAAPIRDRDGQIEGVVLVFHDVTDQRLAEKALRDSDRLATTGKLAATIAHEIHNPLDAVGNLLYLIGQESRENTTREFASMASQELLRITQLTQQMLTFQREASRPVPVKIAEILENVIALYDRKIKSAGIQLQQQVDFNEDILGLPGELRQMFANLVGNAIEAVGSRGGTITLRAYSSQDWRSRRPGLRVVVADNGPGIPAEVRARIFEPFFTTKGESGTGLGLWIASDILRKYEGKMQLRSSTQKRYSGTCFSIFLPFFKADSASMGAAAK